MKDHRNPVQMLMHWAERRPNAPWLFQPHGGQWQRTTWGEADAQVRRMASALHSLGLAPGARIAISGLNTAHWFLADMAITMAGYVSVGLYPKQQAEHVTYILEHSESRALFLGPMSDADEFMRAVPAGTRTVRFPYPAAPKGEFDWDDLIAAHVPMHGYTPPAPESLSTLVYTSGTTGKPKGVMITQQNSLFATAGGLKAMPPVGTERLFCYLPLAHMFERGAVELTSLYLGAEVWFLESIDKLGEQIVDVQPTRFFGVPLVYTRMQAAILKKLPQAKLDKLLGIPLVSTLIRRKIRKGLGLSRARYIIVGAAPMPDPLTNWFARLGVTILQGYGMTENSIYATVNLPHANRVGSVGREMPGAGLKIADDGEILFKSDAVMAGYYKEPDKTRETFTADGYLKTGDQGRVEDGYLYITGRVKDLFKTAKGKYVSPSPIEGALARNADLDQLCFIGTGLNQPIMLATLSAAAKSRPHAEIEARLIADLDEVNATLEPHEKIAKIVIVNDTWGIDNGLTTPTMKIKRSEVEKRYAALLQREAQTRSKIAWET
ncbi:MAG: long-chain fatty acid--CoA ligase [Hydrocarboniphaga sp.]|uniref:AMP-binding protein n=1 Tax=Hydrocarboniphaga sp. TaxID=2033016 RepID=UPI002616D15A|nr:AMP-binding protein [Hydrocarboniphaga sp.]MDB5970943.1 long-chain fatty acid--CoA ligase [Hydrocarboniphaga sp.]